MVIIDVEQGTEEWHKIRAGVITASNMDKIITPTGKPAKTDYLWQVAGESLLEAPGESWEGNRWTDRGKELEPEARDLFQFITGKTVEQVGFVFRDDLKRVGCSPDGLIVGEKSGLEIKCLGLKAHVRALYDNTYPSKYIPQLQGSLYVTGYNSWYMFMYYPGLEPLLKKVLPDKEYQTRLDSLINSSIKRLDEIRRALVPSVRQ